MRASHRAVRIGRLFSIHSEPSPDRRQHQPAHTLQSRSAMPPITTRRTEMQCTMSGRSPRRIVPDAL